MFKSLSTHHPGSSSSSNSNPTVVESFDEAYRFIDLLLSEFGASPDKLGGYPLARSVLSSNIRLIRLLLDHGARPSINQNLVIMVAIETGDLEILRLLIEPDYIHPLESIDPNPRSSSPHLDPPQVEDDRHRSHPINPILPSQSDHHRTRRRQIEAGSQSKRIKLEDRVQVTDLMLERAIKRRDPSMARYFIEKGARPTLETIRIIESFSS